MSHAQTHQALSEDEYLRQEVCADIKHEFVSGETYAMAGASERHNRIAGNVFYHLREYRALQNLPRVHDRHETADCHYCHVLLPRCDAGVRPGG